jgi:hypothetical protein
VGIDSVRRDDVVYGLACHTCRNWAIPGIAADHSLGRLSTLIIYHSGPPNVTCAACLAVFPFVVKVASCTWNTYVEWFVLWLLYFARIRIAPCWIAWFVSSLAAALLGDLILQLLVYAISRIGNLLSLVRFVGSICHH